MENIYPVQAYLHKIGKMSTPICLHCGEGVSETLTLFVCVCPKFSDAQTSAHNQVWACIASDSFFLTCIIGQKWKMFEGTCTGLILSPVSAASISQAKQRLVENDSQRMCALDRRQPNWIFVSNEFKKIANVYLCHPSDVHPDQLKALRQSLGRRSVAHQQIGVQYI
jgi:hypothetical protein